MRAWRGRCGAELVRRFDGCDLRVLRGDVLVQLLLVRLLSARSVQVEKRAAHVGSVYSFFFAGYHRTTTRLQRGPPQRDPPSYAADLHSPLLQQPRHRSTDLDPPHRAPERGKSHTRTTGGREHDDGGAPPWNCNELHRRRGWRRRAGVWVSLFIFT